MPFPPNLVPGRDKLPHGWATPVVEALRRGSRFRWPLTGTSMHPTLRAGTWIELEPIRMAASLRPGQIVMYLYADRFVVHRLIAPLGGRNSAYWLLQGDGLKRPDPPVPTQAILARVVQAWDGAKPYWPRAWDGVMAYWWVLRGGMLALATRCLIR